MSDERYLIIEKYTNVPAFLTLRSRGAFYGVGQKSPTISPTCQPWRYRSDTLKRPVHVGAFIIPASAFCIVRRWTLSHSRLNTFNCTVHTLWCGVAGDCNRRCRPARRAIMIERHRPPRFLRAARMLGAPMSDICRRSRAMDQIKRSRPRRRHRDLSDATELSPPSRTNDLSRQSGIAIFIPPRESEVFCSRITSRLDDNCVSISLRCVMYGVFRGAVAKRSRLVRSSITDISVIRASIGLATK